MNDINRKIIGWKNTIKYQETCQPSFVLERPETWNLPEVLPTGDILIRTPIYEDNK